VSITYDTTTGNKSSSIVGGALTIAASTSSSAINYLMRSAGSALNPGAIGTSSIALPGTITIDNTFGSDLVQKHLATSQQVLLIDWLILPLLQ
jgi:mucin-19